MNLLVEVEIKLHTEFGRVWLKIFFGPGGLLAPCVLAWAMRSLAIVITIVQSFSPFFSSFLRIFFDPLRGNSQCAK